MYKVIIIVYWYFMLKSKEQNFVWLKSLRLNFAEFIDLSLGGKGTLVRAKHSQVNLFLGKMTTIPWSNRL